MPSLLLPLALAAALILAAGVYLAAAARPRTGRNPWPAHRSLLWLLGLATIAAAVLGPLAGAAHERFPAHVAAHLLAGMLAPLLIVLSAPGTLALRTLDVSRARRLSRLLNSGCLRFLTDPAPAAVLNIGSLWVLYATPASRVMQADGLHYLLLGHFFVAGYLFTVSIIGIDPAPHRRSFQLRLAVLVLAIAAHSILAKHIAGHPPARMPAAAAEQGAMLMYYGGDLLEIILVALFCAQWYRASRPAAAQLDRRAMTT